MTITVKVSQLRLSPLNVRKVEPKGVEQMATSILAHGVVQSLTVYEEGGKYLVFAGGRRFRGLASLIHDARFRARSGHLLRLAVLRGRPASLAFVSPHSD